MFAKLALLGQTVLLKAVPTTAATKVDASKEDVYVAVGSLEKTAASVRRA